MQKIVALIKRIIKNDINMVIPILDSGKHATLTIAKILNVDYCEGFIKNCYIGRNFIISNQ